MKIILLLTATVTINKIFMFQYNKEERINTYLKSVHHWLNNTTFPIVFVENSNYDFPAIKNPRFEYITYDETKFTETYDSPSKGICVSSF